MISTLLRPIRKTGSRRSRGQSLVEMALILPIFLVVLMGLLDMGFMLYSRMTIVNAAREGARWAVNQSVTTTIPANLNSSTGAIGSNIPGLTWGNLTVTLACVQKTGLSACDFVASNGTRDAAEGDSIMVRTTYAHTSFFARIFGSTVQLGTQVQMVLEPPDD